MGFVCAICITWGSLVPQQAEVPAASKPGFLNRLWNKFRIHREYVFDPTQYTPDIPGSGIVSSGVLVAAGGSPQASSVSNQMPSMPDLTDPATMTLIPATATSPDSVAVTETGTGRLPDPADLTFQLESLRKQKVEIEQQEAKLIEALKKKYEADKTRLEEEQKQLEKLGVLPLPESSMPFTFWIGFCH
jgi:hypothetical protein